MGRRVILRDVVQKNAKEIVLMDVAENKKNTGDLEATVVMTGAPKKTVLQGFLWVKHSAHQSNLNLSS